MSNNKLLKNSSVYGLVQILQKAIGLFLLPLYTRVLTTTDKGITEIVQPIVAFLVIFYTLTLNTAIIRYYIDYKDDKEKLKEFWGTCITFIMLNSVVLTVLMILFRNVILTPILSGVPFFPYMILGLISITFNPIYTIYQSTLQAQGKSVQYGKQNLCYFLLNLFLNIFFVAGLRIGALGVLLSLAITDTIFFIYAAFKFLPTITLKIKKSYLIQGLKYSLPLLPHTLSGWAVAMIDKLFIGQMSGVALTGVYSTGAQFATVLNVLTTAVNQAYVPWFFEKMKNKKDNEKEIVKTGEIILIVYCVIAMGMSLFGPEIFRIMVGKAFRGGWIVIPFLCFAYVYNGMYYLFVNSLFYNKKGVKFIAIGTFTAAFLNMILNYIFIPYFGIIGASLASLISFIVACILIYIISQKIEPLKFNFIKMNFIVIVFLGISMTTYLMVNLPFWISVLIKLIIVVIVFTIIGLKYRDELGPIMELIKNKIKK